MKIQNLVEMVIGKVGAQKQLELLTLLKEVQLLESKGYDLELSEEELKNLSENKISLDKLIEQKIETVKKPVAPSQEDFLNDILKNLGVGNDATQNPLGQNPLGSLFGGVQGTGIPDMLNNPLAQIILGTLTKPQNTQQKETPVGLDPLLTILGTVLESALKPKEETTKEDVPVESSSTYMEEDVSLDGHADFEDVQEEVVEEVNPIQEETTSNKEEDTFEYVEEFVDEEVTTTPVEFNEKIGMEKKNVHSGWNVTYREAGTNEIKTGLVIAKWVERADVMIETSNGTFKKKKVRYEDMISLSKTNFSNPKPEGSGWSVYKTGTLSLFSRKVPVIFLGEKDGLERVLLLNSTGDKYHLTKEEIKQYLTSETVSTKLSETDYDLI